MSRRRPILLRAKSPQSAKGGLTLVRRILSDRRGGVAVITAIALPALLMLAVGAIELTFVMRDKTQSQNVADAAALMGAKEMAIAQIGAADRTKAYALEASKDLKTRSSVHVTVTTPTDNSIKVTVHTHRQSFFGNILPPGGFHTYAHATATSMRQAPLCVMTTANSGSDTLLVSGNSRMTASCLVHSDRDLKVDSGAALTGRVVEAVTSVQGVTTPVALTGVQSVGDPFTAVDVDFPSGCAALLNVDINWSQSLSPGLHCANYEIKNGATLTLAAGIHYFAGDIDMKVDSKLVSASDGVTMVFGKDAEFLSKDGADISLAGSKTGKLAGFVMATTRDYTSDFKLNSNPISKITGAIYVPAAMFLIEGDKQAAASSDWTVIAAKKIKLAGQPNLVINANYAGSMVPVPNGVGPNTGSRLSQ